MSAAASQLGAPAAGAPSLIDWGRLARRILLGSLLLVAALTLYKNATGSQYAFDFHGGIWRAGTSLLDGRSPYPPPIQARLISPGNAFIPPPPLAVLAVPFSLLPFSLAVVLWNLACTAAMLGALRLLGVSDVRVYVVALCSFPFVSSLVMGQPDGLFALAAAFAWRERESDRGAVAVGALVAAKLFAWPLLLWLLVTRRLRGAAVAAGSAVAFLACSWALIGFQGLANYPRLLAADAEAFATRSQSALAALLRLGAPASLARAGAVALALLALLVVIAAARDRDRGWFTGAILFGLLTSPIMWSHYLTLLLVPLAVSYRRFHAAWLLPALLWLSPLEPPPTVVQILLVLAIAIALSVRASAHGTESAVERAQRNDADARHDEHHLPLGLGRLLRG